MSKWLISLSNGETIDEMDLKSENASDPSPWNKLMQRLEKEKDLHITQIRLQVRGRTYTAPASSQKAKFPSNCEIKNHRYFGRISQDSFGQSEHYICFEFEVKDILIRQIVSRQTGDSWIEVFENAKM